MKVWNNKIKQAGFSLIEISVVVLIVSVVASSSLNLLGKKNNADNKSKTEKRLRHISKAIQVYYNTNKKLPCPASFANGQSVPSCADLGTIPSGIWQYDGTSDKANIVGGFVPFVTLGLPPHLTVDEWDRRISYIVDADLTIDEATFNAQIPHIEITNPTSSDNNYGSHSIFRNPKADELETTVESCRDESGGTDITVDNLTDKIPVCMAFTLISSGANGYKAYTIQGNLITGALGNGPYDLENSLVGDEGGSFDDVLVQVPEDTEVGSANYFDDILVYRSKGKIISEYLANQ